MTRFLDGNRLTLLRCGAEYFPALEQAIDSARQEIFLQTYIYQTDEIGLRIAEAFKRATQRGVKVCLLIDGFGSYSLSKKFVRDLQQARINVLFYRPKISPLTLKRNRLRRLHSKIAVIDGKVAFVGGINIIDDFDGPKAEAPRIDYAVRIEGPLLGQITHEVRRLWRRIEWMNFRRSRVRTGPVPVTHPFADGVRAALVTRDNVLHRRDFERIYMHAITHAESDILIANAYFLPGRAFRRALISAVKRGVRVRLLLQGRMEYMLLFATHSFYNKLLANGIEIYEYEKGFMHSKVAVIDNDWATVGSSNLDPFSFLLAREANIVVRDKAFTAELRQDIEKTIREGTRQIEEGYWKRLPFYRRGLSWVMYQVIRIMLSLIGYPGKH